MTSARNFLVRGLLAGLVAGLVAFGVAYVVGEPSVNASIAIEESGGAAMITQPMITPRNPARAMSRRPRRCLAPFSRLPAC